MISVFLAANKLNKKQLPPVAMAKNTLADKIGIWQKTKDVGLRDEILNELKPTIKSALHSFASGKLDSLLVPAMKLTLQALLTYDLSKKIQPATYLYHNLQRLNRIRRLRLNIIHIPLNIVYLQDTLNKASAKLLDLLGRLPTVLLLADATGISSKRIIKTMDTTGISTINDSSAVSQLSGQLMFGQSALTDKDYMDYVYKSVDPVNKKIIEWSSPYYGKKQLLGTLIAKKLHLSPGAVSQRRAYISNMLSQIRLVL